MGVGYQAAVVMGGKPEVRNALRNFPEGTVELRVRGRPTVGVVLFPLGASRGFHEQADELTRQLSRVFGHALLIQYDDRIGLREAIEYRDGEPARQFGPADESWVPLDARGRPRHDVPSVRVGELKPGEEYETAATAIDRGLEAFGVNPPLTGSKLRDLVLAAG